MKSSKKRLDKLVFELGLAETRSKAQALIITGQVLVDNTPVTKSGTLVSENSQIIVKKSNPYVSRGALKLESAVIYFGISFQEKICMDVGASTGGFTDYMLQHGAGKVYAVDVGRNLLHEKLQRDPRVVSIENTNFRYFSKELLKEDIEFVTIDVSFISLDKILPVVEKVVKSGCEILAMVKPQFEVTPKEIKKGVVRDEKIRQGAIEKIRNLARSLGFEVLGGVDSAVKGPEGNIEHFLWLKKVG